MTTTPAQTDRLRHIGKRAHQIIIDNGGRHAGCEDQLKPLAVEAMRQLGATRDDVAAQLVQLRCTGRSQHRTDLEQEGSQLSAEDNPLAAYLVGVCGFAGVVVQGQCDDDADGGVSYKVDVAWPGTGFDPEQPAYDDYTMGLDVPEPIAAVLRDFERGELRQLYRPSDAEYPVWQDSSAA